MPKYSNTMKTGHPKMKNQKNNWKMLNIVRQMVERNQSIIVLESTQNRKAPKSNICQVPKFQKKSLNPLKMEFLHGCRNSTNQKDSRILTTPSLLNRLQSRLPNKNINNKKRSPRLVNQNTKKSNPRTTNPKKTNSNSSQKRR